VIDCVFWICFHLLSASISILQGAGIDVAGLYIALAFGLSVDLKLFTWWLLGFYSRVQDAVSAFSHHPAGSWSQREAGNLKRIFE
jgi:hypothetical protein